MQNFADSSRELNRLSERFTVSERPGSQLLTVRNKLIVPERKIILPDSPAGRETLLSCGMADKPQLIL